MVQYFTVAGRQVGSHVLAMATLGVTGVGAYLGLRGGDSGAEKNTPPIKADSGEEEKFIREFLANVEKEEQKAKH
ncbi:hypothetical protein BZA05DRAFT_393275 [Tricharina praecox]|uniref:uncharacterized protein n=1 Tax=Tricharina praecox TaxID=43433 RepID=UPI00221F4CF7|nr:uncharacterized protein BZA05DRAFT_393275 [Tricharina praecox]KAI5854120.1 hypothetical protein BZA05DRAFT_393275 [Tricharina praecox]